MSFIDRLRPKAALSGQVEKLIREIYGGYSTSSGVSVTSDSAMRLSHVYSCVNTLSRSIAQLPCHLMQQVGRKKDKATDFYLYPLLHDQPNEWMTAPEFWGMAMNHLTLRGNFFCLKSRISGNRIRELIPLAPGIVNEVKQNPDYTLVYKCTFPDGTRKDIPSREMMHLRALVINGFMGVNPIQQYARETIGLGLAMQEFGARFFGTGTHPGIIVEHPGKLSQVAHDNLKNSLTESYSGLGNTHRLLLLEEGMKAQKIVIDPKDSQFLESGKFNKSQIVDIFFGMPLTMLHSGDATPTFASAEQFSLSYIVYALTPWLVNIEKAISRDLLTEEERKKYYAKFSVGGLLRGSMRERAEFYRTMVNTEIFSPNEVRELEDLNPYDNGGDEYRTRTSSIKQAAEDVGASSK